MPGPNEPPCQALPRALRTFLAEVQRGAAPRAGAAPPAPVGLGVDGSPEAVVAPAAGARAAPRVGAAVAGPAAGPGAGAAPAVAVPVAPGPVAPAVAPGAAGARAAARVGAGAGAAPGAPGQAPPGPGARATPAARGAARGAAGAGAARGAAGGAAGAGAGTAPPGARRGLPVLGRAQRQVVHELRHVGRLPRAAFLGALSCRLGFGCCSAVPRLCSWGER